MYDPEDLSVYADIAGTLADHGRLDDALAWADRALAKDPEFDCAVHTAHRLRYRADGDLAHLISLADFQRDHPDDTHEHADLADCCADQPWLSRVPAAPGTPTDPARQPVAAGRPSAAAVQRLHRVAHPLWPHPPAAYDAALGLVLVEPEDLLALIAHPPTAPENEVGQALAVHDPALWTRCAQVWAALGLLHQHTDEPWAESQRRRLLVDLAVGGTDQIAEAALFALVTAAWVEPAARADVAELVTRRLQEITAAGHPMSWSVAQLALATPELPASAREQAAAVVRAEEDHAAPAVPRQLRRGGRLRRWLSGRTNR
jgi:hypothetical protein